MTVTPLKGALRLVLTPVQAVPAPLKRTSKVCGDVCVCTTSVTRVHTPDPSVPPLVDPLGTVCATRVFDPGARCRRTRREPIDGPAPLRLHTKAEPAAGFMSTAAVISVAEEEKLRWAIRKAPRAVPPCSCSARPWSAVFTTLAVLAPELSLLMNQGEPSVPRGVVSKFSLKMVVSASVVPFTSSPGVSVPAPHPANKEAASNTPAPPPFIHLISHVVIRTSLAGIHIPPAR